MEFLLLLNLISHEYNLLIDRDTELLISSSELAFYEIFPYNNFDSPHML